MLPNPIPVIVAAFVLVQAPPIQAPQITQSEGLAELYGRTLGAASQCPDVARQRIDDATAKASARIKTLAANDAERTAAGTVLARAADVGSRDVESGATTCVQAESELANLERELAAAR